MPNENTNQNIDAADPGVEETTQSAAEVKTEEQKPVSFDDMLKDPKFQSAFDKKVAKAIETSRAKWEAESKMSEDERAEAQLTEREKNIKAREEAQEKREFTAEIREELAKNSLPGAFAEVLAEGCTKDNVSAVLGSIKAEWDKQMAEQLKAGARQKDPIAGSPVGVGNDAKPDIAAYAKEIRKVD